MVVACFPDGREERRRRNGGWHRLTPRCRKFFSQYETEQDWPQSCWHVNYGKGKQMSQYMRHLQEYFSQPCNPAAAEKMPVISPVVTSQKSDRRMKTLAGWET